MIVGRHPASRAAYTVVLAAALAFTARAQEVDCLLCHQALSKQTNVHLALSAGCKTCHSAIDAAAIPHKVTGKVAKGLAAEPPGLCHGCHDLKQFEGKITHAPVAAGVCVLCHEPHSSDYAKLLKKEPVALCLDCHAGVKKTPHVAVGFTRAGHPLGDEKKGAIVADPLRPGRAFYCGSCHETHRSEFAGLLRFDSRSRTGYCQPCHKF